MVLNAAETIVKSSGDLYLAPVSTASPAVADLANTAAARTALETAGWVHTGWIEEEGPTPEGFEGDNEKHYGWNAVAPARSTTRVTEPMVNVPLLQWNVENLSLYFPGATHDTLTETLTIPEGGNSTESALLTVVRDGDKAIGLWCAKTSPRGGDSFEFPGDAMAVIPVAFDILGGVVPWVKVIGVDVAA